jgi:hypothetical protein
MGEALVFQPLLPWPVILAAAAVMAALVALALWRGLKGWWLRAAAALAVLAALAEPSWKQEDRDYLPDIAFLVIDETSSQGIDVRPDQMAGAVPGLQEKLAALRAGPGSAPGQAPVELRTIRVGDGTGDARNHGSLLLAALAQAAAEVSPDRIAGAILVTDGRVHDPEALAAFPGPVHVLLTGRDDEWDRRLVVETAPSFAIVGEPADLTVRVDSLGAAPEPDGGRVPLLVSIDGADPMAFEVPLGTSVTIPIELARGGMNVVQVIVPEVPGELTPRNNAAVLSVNGIRDRLRVLLVSGEPYAGERTWRNLLKSDAAVDLVHFTILRPPEKQDGVPVFELSLIAFPTRELFMDKVDEFDLIIFDRYQRRGVLPSLYLDNVARYVRDGGALLIASGPGSASADSLFRTPLRDVLPAEPTARVLEEAFVPLVSGIGQRHPVTRGLADFAPRPVAEDGTPGWGRWFRLVEMDVASGTPVMEGPDGAPLLLLDRPGEGRVALLASDHAWLWSRGFEGGGPQQELLRRLAHWLMKEPELEEEVLVAEPDGASVTVTRRTLGEAVGPVTVTLPSGATQVLTLTEGRPGEWQGRFEAPEDGIYRLAEAELTAVTAVGPAAPKEFEDPVSTGAVLAPLADATLGGVLRLAETGVPDIRRVRAGREAAGRGWIGLARREAYAVEDIRLTSLAPGWLMLLLAGGIMVAAWRIEGR